MKTFRGPHPHDLPGLPHDSSDDEIEDEDLVIIQPIFHAGHVGDSDESEDELNEVERIGFGLQFQPHHHYLASDEDDDEDAIIDLSMDEENDNEEEEEDDDEEYDSDDEGDEDDVEVQDEAMGAGAVPGPGDGVNNELNDLEDVIISTPTPSPKNLEDENSMSQDQLEHDNDNIDIENSGSAVFSSSDSPSEPEDADSNKMSSDQPIQAKGNENESEKDKTTDNDIEMSRCDNFPATSSDSPPTNPAQIDDPSPVPEPVENVNSSPFAREQTPSASPVLEDHPTPASDSDPDPDPERDHEAMDHDDEEEEQFCNPMVSSVDDQENEDVLRGDRIGESCYSERHVLKILMKWVEKLPYFASGTFLNKSSGTPTSSATSSPVVAVDPLDKPLDDELEESMSLLWDMSAETDVMYFLIDNNILLMIRDNLDTANCPTRLKEIALGILANLLSCSNILETFPEKDEHLNLVDRVVMEALSSTAVPLLTQVFAVLRRVVCYIRNAKPLDRWMKLFLHPDFIQAANFLLASSTNVILLGDVIMMFFTLMEVLSPPQDFEFQDSTSDETSKYEATMALNFKPFIQSEFVPSVCEGLNELLKGSRGEQQMDREDVGRNYGNPSGNTDPTKLPHCPTTGNGPDEDRNDFVVPPGHVQTACLNGLASLCYLQKFKTGKDILKKHTKSLMDVLLGIFGKFRFCTERIDGADILDYYALAVDLLTLCHLEFERILPLAITIPISATIVLVEEEGKTEKELDHDDSHLKTTHLVTIDNGGSVRNAADSPLPEVSSETSATNEEDACPNQNRNRSVEMRSSDVSPFTVILYNYFIAMEEKFGQEEIKKVIQHSGSNKKRLADFYFMVRQVADKVHNKGNSGESPIRNDASMITSSLN